MLSNIRLASLLGLALTSSLVNAGPYLGIGLGPQFADFGQESHVQLPGSFNVTNDTHISALGVFGTLFAGYGYTFNRAFYIAGEVNADLNSLDAETSNSEFVHLNFATSDYKVTPTFGISLLPGYVFADSTLFYARLGYAATNFQLNTSNTSLANIDKYVGGFRFGFGIKKTILNNISARMEYSQVRYPSTSITTRDPASGVTNSTSIRPQTGEVEFSLIYDFV